MTTLSTAAAAEVTPPRLARVRAAAGRVRVSPMVLFWVLIAAILIAPIAIFLSAAFFPAVWGLGDETFSLASFQTAVEGRLLQSILDSLGLGIVVSIAATALSLALAWIAHRTNAPGRGLTSGAVFGLLLCPSYLIAMSWQRLFEPMGVLDVLGVPTGALRGYLYGPAGIAMILTVKGVPFAYLAISSALRGLGQEFEDAIRVHGGSPIEAMKLVVKLLAPAVWSSLAIVFAEAISDFGVATTLAKASKFPVATFGIYNAIQAFPVQFGVAAAISWILLGLIVAALLVQNWALRGRSYRVLGGRTRMPRQQRLPAWARAVATVFVALFLLLALGVPIFGAVSASLISHLGKMGHQSLTLDHYRNALTSPALQQPLLFSAQMALIVATLTVVLATVCARIMAKGGNSVSSKLLDFILLAAVALPGIVFAAGYIFTYNLGFINDLGIHLYGTTWLLGLAYLASSLPSTTRLLFGNMSQLHVSMLDSARAHGAGPVRTWASIVFPVLARPMLSAWMLTFAHIILELPISQLLYPPAHPPLVVGIQSALDQYDFGGGTAMQILAILLSLAVIGVASRLFRLLAPRGWLRIGKAS